MKDFVQLIFFSLTEVINLNFTPKRLDTKIVDNILHFYYYWRIKDTLCKTFLIIYLSSAINDISRFQGMVDKYISLKTLHIERMRTWKSWASLTSWGMNNVQIIGLLRVKITSTYFISSKSPRCYIFFYKKTP